MTFPVHPAQASKLAQQADYLYWGLTALSAATLLVVFAPMLYFLFKYRRGKPADRTPIQLPQTAMEITWTLIPIIIFTGLFAWGANVYWTMERAPAGAMELNVVAKQWMWKIQHPEGNREINELHVPLGRIVKLTLASQDVIHSFFLPEFRIKQDVVPGRYTTIWFKAERLGAFHLFCSEYCGTHHSAMIGRVVVMKPQEYEEWLARGEPGATMAQAGAQLYRVLGCSGCHDNGAIIRAPPLQGLYGNPVPLQSGQIVTADVFFLRDSILLPANDIAGGYTNDMPSFQGRVSEDELAQLMAYLKNMGSQRPIQNPNPTKQ